MAFEQHRTTGYSHDNWCVLSMDLCRIGTSPEFELALYTLCFVGGSEKNIIRLNSPTGEYEIEIRSGPPFPVIADNERLRTKILEACFLHPSAYRLYGDCLL